MKQQPKNRRKRVLRWVLGILLMLFYVVISMTPVNMLLPHNRSPYVYSADNNEYCEFELGKAQDPYGRVLSGFEAYKLKKGNPSLQLYRCFKPDWWQIWNWPDFLVHNRWYLPYNPDCEECLKWYRPRERMQNKVN
ncbi:MAG: hypothetical protein IT269_14370 [Saprospiraceae bacterium]|nr:hypothetical protein [Saprospiraceae bacterium]